MSAQEEVLEIAKQAYIESSVFPSTDEEAKEGLGDGLATFLYNEIKDVTTGYDDLKKCLELSLEAVSRARREIEEVESALYCRFHAS